MLITFSLLKGVASIQSTHKTNIQTDRFYRFKSETRENIVRKWYFARCLQIKIRLVHYQTFAYFGVVGSNESLTAVTPIADASVHTGSLESTRIWIDVVTVVNVYKHNITNISILLCMSIAIVQWLVRTMCRPFDRIAIQRAARGC